MKVCLSQCLGVSKSIQMLTAIFFIGYLPLSCLEKKAPRHRITASSDAKALSNPDATNVLFSLPDRDVLDEEDAKDILANYEVLANTEEDSCDINQSLSLQGLYEDGKKVSFVLNRQCDYILTVNLGTNSSSELHLATPEEVAEHKELFEQSVSPIFETACIACHNPTSNNSDLTTYESSLAYLADIQKHLEEQTMPTGTPLPETQSDVILDWVAAAPTSDETSTEEDEEDEATKADRKEPVRSSITAIYSFDNALVRSKSMIDQNSLKLDISFDLQEAGEDYDLPETFGGSAKPRNKKDNEDNSNDSEDKSDSNTNSDNKNNDSADNAPLSFQDDMQPLLDQYCTSCHSPEGSQSSSDLTTYDGAKEWGKESADRVVSGNMPIGPTLEKEDQEVFVKWAEQGFPE